MVINCLKTHGNRIRMRSVLFRWTTVSFLGVLTVLFDGHYLSGQEKIDNGDVQAGREKSANELVLSNEISGKIVCQGDDGIYVSTLGENQGNKVAHKGRFPRWSPDGERIAYIENKSIMVISSSGGLPRKIARAVKPRSLCFSSDGNSIFFTDGKKLHQVEIDTLTIKTVHEGEEFYEIDVAKSNAWLSATVRTPLGYTVYAIDLQSGKRRRVASGCSASLSPDGTLITVNDRNHRFLRFYDWQTLQVKGRINAPYGKKFDNHFWSNNQRWIVHTVEEEGWGIYLHDVPSDSSYRVSALKNCDRADLYVHDEKV